MSKRDLLRKANAGNAQNRGTEAVLNEAPTTKIIEETPEKKAKVTIKSATRKNIKPVEVSPSIEVEKEVATKVSATTPEVKEIDVIKETEPKEIQKEADTSNLAKYTASKISKSIMLTAEDNKYLIKQAAAQKRPIQDIFAQIMADEIEEVKKGNIDEELAETFLKLKANNERRNVLIPEDLSIAIADTASEIPLKQGKFILYALSRKRIS